jgi:hypothetical protein
VDNRAAVIHSRSRDAGRLHYRGNRGPATTEARAR